MNLGERIKEVRLSNEKTLKELAELSGISVSYLSDIERGRTLPTINILASIATALGISVIDLLSGVAFVGDLTHASLPQGLAELMREPNYVNQITEDWVKLLSSISLGGHRPKSKDDFVLLFLVLKRMLI